MHIEEIKLIKTIKKDKEYNWFDAEAELEKEYDQKNLNNVLDALKGNFEKIKLHIFGVHFQVVMTKADLMMLNIMTKMTKK
jgi:hypothetical protein